MARNIQQSLSDLEHDLASFRQSTSQFNHAAGSIAMLFRSRAFKSAAKTVEIQQKFDAAVRLRDRAKDIIEAKNAMMAQPNRWKSTSDYLKERDELKAARERVSERKKNKASAFTEWHNRQYGNTPSVLRDRIRQFGGLGGSVAFEQDFADAYNSEFDPKTYQYEQDVKTWGRAKADTLKQRREDRERKQNRYQYARLQATRRKDERERLYNQAPWMKSLVQSGIIDKKFIPQIAKGVDKLSGIKQRGSAVLAAANVIDRPWREYNKYRRLHLEAKSEHQAIGDAAVFGSSGVYSKLGSGLRMDEIGSIKSFQRLQARFGPATMEVLKAYGESMKDAPGWVRQNLAGEWGLSGDDANIAMFLGGGKEFTKDHAYNASKVGRAKLIRDLRRSGTVGAAYAEIYDKLPLAGPLAETLMQSDSEMEKIQKHVNKVIKDSQDEASRPTPVSSDTNIGGDNNISSNISTPINITVYGNADAEEIASVTANSVTKAISRRANIDYISQGVLG